ncbi:MAG: hypothetical protein QS98_C0010G0033 [archaeon GW2011_AR3]|nr:MAG: hypothetical protein QS98_C0010G0033 [archaeon GW2011_AR3]MBS3110176.1 DUF87 domain-containing protein [Candidatus Woesearchaeota archaeon]
MYDVILGRSEEDRHIFGDKGAVFLGKHYVKMGQTTSLSNSIYLDVARSHVVFVCGKRGGGKSYTMGIIAEEMARLPPEVNKNLSIIMLDTMGVYWTMRYPNQKEKPLLDEWKLKPMGMNVQIFTPVGYYRQYKEEGIPTDFPFAIRPKELDPDDWCTTFEIKLTEPIGVVIEKAITSLREKNLEYTMEDIKAEIEKDDTANREVKEAAVNRFISAESWGVFDEKGTQIKDLAIGGKVTVLDVSCYATMASGWKIKALVIGLVAQKLFVERMKQRKEEEFQDVKDSQSYFSSAPEKQKVPLVWLVVDEAHEFLPLEGDTVASFPLITILREGRQPGISLVLASQQPGKIHTDVMTQSDVVIAHRITAKIDVEALGALMQSYMREGLSLQLDNLPRTKGSALIFDDVNERMYPMRMRPRLTWHGGGSPSALSEQKKFEF